MKRKTFQHWLGFLCTTALLCINNCLAATVVAPNDYENRSGEGSELLPVLNGTGRFQNVYEREDFFEVIPQGGIISEIALRMDDSIQRDLVGQVQDLEIRMSITPALDPIRTLEFSANVGNRVITVFGRKALEYAAIDNGLPVKDFNVRVLLDQPFAYSPAEGGLVVDYFFNKGATTTFHLDSAVGFGLQGGINEARASIYRGVLISQFTVTPIPEPSTRALLVAIGLFGFSFRNAKRMRMLNCAWVLLYCVGVIGAQASSPSQSLVAPPGHDNTPGAGSDSWPFETGRTQNVFPASQFQDALRDGGFITHIAFRLNENVTRAYSGSVGNLEVRMGISASTTPVVSLDFAANHGPRNTVVFGPKALKYEAPAGAAGLKPFSFLIPLDSPFPYHPSEGGLVIDYFFHQGPRDGVLLDLGNGAFGLTGGLNASRASDFRAAFVTEFRYIAIPEPRVCVLTAVGSALLLIFKRTR